jgi:catechol 2,3-dioxygenase-like lactoylglutathione lyase family enzyme
MTLRDIDHVYNWVRDMDAAVDFYRDVVGLELVRREGDEWAEFAAPPIRLALHAIVHEDAPGGGTVVFRVDDLDRARWSLEREGAVFDEHLGEVEGFARFALFRDPDGNPIQIIEYLTAPS